MSLSSSPFSPNQTGKHCERTNPKTKNKENKKTFFIYNQLIIYESTKYPIFIFSAKINRRGTSSKPQTGETLKNSENNYNCCKILKNRSTDQDDTHNKHA